MNSFQAMTIRAVNAENSFINAVQEQFGKTEEEAGIILTVFKREKVVKIDPVLGQFFLVSGLFWEANVMDNALAVGVRK